MKACALVLVLAALAGAAPAAAQEAAAAAVADRFDPRDYQGRVHGRKTEVLVLGSPHLSGAPADFDAAALEPLLARLEAFAPDVIAIENLSGESLHALRAYDGVYQTTADDYGRLAFVLAALARAGTGLDLPEAEAEARRLLAELPDDPTPAQRRRLAAVFAAAGDPNSALVQWWRLDPAERKAGDGVRQPLVDQLEAYAARRNESHLIGARLAARLGLERVHPVDDHAGDDAMLARIEPLTAWFSRPEFDALRENPDFVRLSGAAERLTTPEQLMETYRDLNSPDAGRTDADLQWLIMLDRPSDGNIARVRMGEWEARNLRQVAHIREASLEAPGGRVLVIVGSAHKPWFDAYLGMMSDMEVVDAQAVLR